MNFNTFHHPWLGKLSNVSQRECDYYSHSGMRACRALMQDSLSLQWDISTAIKSQNLGQDVNGFQARQDMRKTFMAEGRNGIFCSWVLPGLSQQENRRTQLTFLQSGVDLLWGLLSQHHRELLCYRHQERFFPRSRDHYLKCLHLPGKELSVVEEGLVSLRGGW